MAKPVDKLNWVPDNDPTKVVQPSTGKKNIGWQAEEKPPFQWFNWTLNVISRWQNYFETTTDTLITSTDTLNSTTSTQGSAITALTGALSTTNTNVTALDDRLDVVEGNLLDRVDELNGHASNLSIDDWLSMVDIATPAAPSAGRTKVYTRSGQLYLRASGGAETLVSAALIQRLANIATGLIANSRYFVDSSAGAFTLTLPVGAAGSKFLFLDYKGSFNNFNVTIAPGNGTDKIANGAAGASIVFDSAYGHAYLEWDTVNSNWVYYGNAASLLGGGGGGLLPDPRSSSFTAVKGKRFLLDLTAAIPIAMPQGVSGAQLAVFDSKGKANKTAGTIATITPYTGQKFEGMLTDEPLQLDGKYQYINFYWDTVNSHWAWETGQSILVGPAGAGVPGTISQEELTTHSTNLVGAIPTLAIVIAVEKLGRLVTLTFPDTRTSGNNTANVITASTVLPTKWRPAVDSRFPISIANNNGQQSTPGMITVGADGSLRISSNTADANFTASAGGTGAYGFSVSYIAAI